MRSSSEKDFAVYEFTEEDEAVEVASGVMTSKFRNQGNPSHEESALSKYTFLQAFAPNMKAKQSDMTDILCLDIDASDSNHKCNARTTNSTGTSERISSTIGEMSAVDEAVASSNSLNVDGHISGDTLEIRDLNPECIKEDYPGRKASSPGTPASGNDQVDCTLSKHPSNGRQVNLSSDEDDSWTSSPSPPTSPSGHIDNEDSSEHSASADCWTGLREIDDADMAVIVLAEFVLYGNSLYGESQFTFHSDFIKIECSDANIKEEYFVSEWGISDVICIDCQWSQSLESTWVRVWLKPTAVAGAVKVDTSVVVRFSVPGLQWSEIEQKIMLLAPRYRDIWNAEPDAEMTREVDKFTGLDQYFSRHYLTAFKEPFDEVVYPKGDPDAVAISKRDIELLQPETFINDTIIDFYIKYLKVNLQQQGNHRFHFFNSFFFRKLVDLDKDPKSVSEGRAAFLRVRKWTRKVDIFEKDYIFVPVNFNLHWSLLVICHPGQVPYFKEEEIYEARKVPCILHMDSIKGSHNGLKNLIQSYLWEEWKERHPESTEDTSSTFSNLRFIPLELPQQENSFDCGLFLLHYVELFLREAPADFSPFMLTKFSNFLNMDWFIPAEASHKRFVIRNLICKLLNNSEKDSQASCSDGQQFLGLPKKDGEKLVEFLSDKHSPDRTGLTDSACSNGRGINVKLLARSPPVGFPYDKEAGFILHQFLEPKATPETSHYMMKHSMQQNATFQKFRCTMSPVEEEAEDAETSEQLVHSDRDSDRPLAGIASTEIGTTSYSPKDVGTLEESSRSPNISLQHEEHEEDGDSSSDNTLSCGSPNLFEKKSETDADLPDTPPPNENKDDADVPHKIEAEKRMSDSPENCGEVPDSPASVSGETLETCVVEDSQEIDAATLSDGKDCGDSFASRRESAASRRGDGGSTDDGNYLDEQVEQRQGGGGGLEKQHNKRRKLMPVEGGRRRTRSFTRNCGV